MNDAGKRAVYIVDGVRTPFLKARGRPGPFSAGDLAVAAGRALLGRQPVRPEQLDEVVVGCVMPAPDEVNIGRVISLRLGCGKSVPAWTVQRNCASGMQALDVAVRNIEAGYSDLVLAGGTEAMSHAPLHFRPELVGWLADWREARGVGAKLALLGRLRPFHLAPVVVLLKGLSDPVVGLSMGQTAENLAKRFAIGREEMDSYAVTSHQRLATAQEEGLFGDEITPLFDAGGGLYDKDDGVRPGSTVETLATLKPVFDRPFGSVTAGNSAQVTDGAAMLLLASGEAVERHGLTVRGRLHAASWAGLAPEQMGLGPVHATIPLLARHRLALGDVDIWEINEAFAVQVLACLRAFADGGYCRQELGRDAPLGEIDRERLNLDGGGVSLGHPVGASGARIVLHVLNLLHRRGGDRGVATLCIGGGQGGAMLIERDTGGAS